jgi:hypothetical protein
MRFQVGKFLCELSLDDDGRVQTRCRSGRKTEPPEYLDVADRRQYRAGREAFLRAAGKLPARLSTGSSWWRTLRRITPVLVVAEILSGCAIQANDAQEKTVVLTKEQCSAAWGRPLQKSARHHHPVRSKN